MENYTNSPLMRPINPVQFIFLLNVKIAANITSAIQKIGAAGYGRKECSDPFLKNNK